MLKKLYLYFSFSLLINFLTAWSILYILYQIFTQNCLYTFNRKILIWFDLHLIPCCILLLPSYFLFVSIQMSIFSFAFQMHFFVSIIFVCCKIKTTSFQIWVRVIISLFLINDVLSFFQIQIYFKNVNM